MLDPYLPVPPVVVLCSFSNMGEVGEVEYAPAVPSEASRSLAFPPVYGRPEVSKAGGRWGLVE